MDQNCTSLKIFLFYVFTSSRKNCYHLFGGTFFFSLAFYQHSFELRAATLFPLSGRRRIASAVGYFHLIIFFRSKVSANRKYLFCECKHAEYFLFTPRNTYHFTLVGPLFSGVFGIKHPPPPPPSEPWKTNEAAACTYLRRGNAITNRK